MKKFIHLRFFMYDFIFIWILSIGEKLCRLLARFWRITYVNKNGYLI